MVKETKEYDCYEIVNWQKINTLKRKIEQLLLSVEQQISTKTVKRKSKRKKAQRIQDIQQLNNRNISQFTKKFESIKSYIIASNKYDENHYELLFPDRKQITDVISDLFEQYSFYKVLGGGFRILTGITWDNYTSTVRTTLFKPEEHLLEDQSGDFINCLDAIFSTIFNK